MSTIAKTSIVSAPNNGGIKVELSTHPAKPHYVLGLVDGQEVAIALAGKGGVDINKLASGRVLALAADGFRPAFEKEAAQSGPKEQKTHNGRPLFLASGFYLLSTKDYPAHCILQGYMRLLDEGERLAIVTEKSLRQAGVFTLSGRDDLLRFHEWAVQALDDAHNFLHRFDADVNKRKARILRRAQEDAEDAGEVLQAVELKPLAADAKDGSAALLLLWHRNGQPQSHLVRRHIEVARDEPLAADARLVFAPPKEAMAAFWRTPAGGELASTVKSGKPINLVAVRGCVMRTSVSARKKIDNARHSTEQHGEAVWLRAALQGWVRGMAPVLSMQHPEFPRKDYDVLHYVAAPRQAEIELVPSEAGLQARARVYEPHQWLSRSPTGPAS
ncbi:MAG: hypothetical protein N2690_05460 [Rhodocyclaceae bacterium]|nr:hypothetical protein [Rhodocyclaceae bacterium]